MSAAEVAAKAVSELEDEDYKVLHVLERNISGYDEIPLRVIQRVASLTEGQVLYHLGRLNALKLVTKGARGYTLVSAGLDAVALHALAKKGVVSGLGRAIGVGKEADVFEALGRGDRALALKFYRIGRISFRDVRRKRAYAPPERQHHWLAVNVRAASREFEAVNKLTPLTPNVPEPLARERHVLVMKRLEGVLLADVKQLEDPASVLREVLATMRTAFTRVRIINGDLSEFNILYDGERIWVIDWPQAIEADHPNAQILLDRDIRNVVRFFQRKFKVSCPFEEASFYVRGWRDTLEIFK